jgi:nitrate reductase alpha subunit
VARQFAENADKTHGKSMIIIGAAMNHWYHMDMNYRGVINLLMMCGCVGQSGGGWSHYVGQEKLRPQTGWTALAFALDWHRPPRHMNSTSFWYIHTSQWRYEKLAMTEILSPLADPQQWQGDANRLQRAGGTHGLAADRAAFRCQSAGSRQGAAAAAGKAPNAYLVENLKSGKVNFAFEDPDNPVNFPRNLFVWRSNLLGSSGKGHEYFLKYLFGATHGVQGKDLGEEGGEKPLEVKWRKGAEGKLDLLVTLDFRMSTTCMYSDIVLPTATWYEKNDLNTSDMHPFIHPLSAAVDPAWESRTDWDIFKGIAKAFSETCPGHLGVEKDIVALPTCTTLRTELAMPDVKDWKKGRMRADSRQDRAEPGRGRARLSEHLPEVHLGRAAAGQTRQRRQGHRLEYRTRSRSAGDAQLHRAGRRRVSKGRPRIDSDIDAAEMIMMLAPETNGHVAVKAWAALSKITGRDHTHLALPKEHEKIRFRDIQAQPRKIISSPTWSGLEDEKVSYNAGYTNVHELIPWRTVTGRQQFYQDHAWMLGFGEAMCAYRPPVDMKTVEPIIGQKPNGNKEIVLNFITPHQKWGIHSTYTDNLLMLTLSRAGPIIWMSEIDAKKASIEDNDWIEAYNVNGAIAARAVVSQRVPEGMSMMYHAQEKIVNTPGSEITGTRGGIHNSVTRTVLKPTHMIGSYAQQSYGFNYYGTVGANRDEFIIVRKMAKVDWLDDEKPRTTPPWRRIDHESTRTNRHGPEPGQVHWLPHLFGDLQERLD